VQTVRALSTLNEDFDYVRAIAYSPVKSMLYSAADNGIVRAWDINTSANKQVRISHISPCRIQLNLTNLSTVASSL
jgi:WD40 repeat protein